MGSSPNVLLGLGLYGNFWISLGHVEVLFVLIVWAAATGGKMGKTIRGLNSRLGSVSQRLSWKSDAGTGFDLSEHGLAMGGRECMFVNECVYVFVCGVRDP